ncbi:MAG: Nramp family divalent metal transporter, partial [Stackebrandtia sp.]
MLWPSITSQVGLILMWAALLSFLTQTFVNMEIERYTIATGETAITGFTRMWKPWGSIFALVAIITHIFPGWATGSATLLTFTLGGGNATYIAIAGLVAIGVALSLSPVVYQAVEKAEAVMVAGIAIFLVLVLFLGTTGEAWGAFATGFGNVGRFPELSAVGGAAALFGAIAFAGVGGTGNLAQSNWIR